MSADTFFVNKYKKYDVVVGMYHDQVLAPFKSMFKFDANSTFDPRYIATGGNLTLNPNNIYSLPSIADGGNYCGFYTPNLRII